jgi:hypothetical protein
LIADMEEGYLATDLFDNTGAIETQNLRRRQWSGSSAAPLGIDRIHGEGSDADEQIVRLQCGLRQGDELQYLRTAIFGMSDCLHSILLSTSRGASFLAV